MSSKVRIPEDWKPWVEMAIPSGCTSDTVRAACSANPGRGTLYECAVEAADEAAFAMRTQDEGDLRISMKKYAALYAKCPASWKAKK
jgi:hypothetical protein